MKKVIIIILVLGLAIFYIVNVFYFSKCSISLSFKDGISEEEIENSLKLYKKIIKNIRVDTFLEYEAVGIFLPSRYLFPLVYYSLKFQNIFDKDLNKVSYSCFVDLPGPSR